LFLIEESCYHNHWYRRYIVEGLAGKCALVMWSSQLYFYQLLKTPIVCQSFRVRVTLQLTVSQSVCLGVEPRLGLMTRYLFWLKIIVLSIWGSLSDERSGLSFVVSLSGNSLAFYRIRRFINVFSRARHWTLSWVGRIEPTVIVVRVFFSLLWMEPQSGSFASDFPDKILDNFLIYAIRGKFHIHLIKWGTCKVIYLEFEIG
jgi:hypothetical protein